jgi:hypothetical protein
MRTRLVLVLCMVALGCSGCARIRAAQQQQAAQESAWQAVGHREITCTEGPDCNAKWQRAIAFVTARSAWKMHMVNDYVIQTEGPFLTTSPAFTIQKVPVAAGQYRIVGTIACGGATCYPSTSQLGAELSTAVLGY